MQTFLPYESFERTARALDPKRLGKQRVEVLQILRAMHRPNYGWRNHPVVRMWRGYEEALLAYGHAICVEWARRGHRDTVAATLQEERSVAHVRSQAELRAAGALPPWLGLRALHRSHRSALVRKFPEWYRPLFPDVPDDLPYVWPVPLTSASPTTRG